MSIDLEAAAAGGLALDILQNGLHLPLKDGKINRDKIEDQITIGLYSNDLPTLFVKVIYKYPVLEKVSFWVVGALGIKLISSYWLHELNTELIDFVFSILVLSSFIIPVLYAKYSRK